MLGQYKTNIFNAGILTLIYLN